MTNLKKLKTLLQEISYHRLEKACCAEWQQYGLNFPAVSVKNAIESLITGEDTDAEYIPVVSLYEDAHVAASGTRNVVDTISFIQKSDLEKVIEIYGAEQFVRILEEEIKNFSSKEIVENSGTRSHSHHTPNEFFLHDLCWNDIANLLVCNPMEIPEGWDTMIAAILYHATLQGFTKEEFDVTTNDHKKKTEIDFEEAQEPSGNLSKMEDFEEEIDYTTEQNKLFHEAYARNMTYKNRSMIDLVRCIYKEELSKDKNSSE